MTIYLVTGETGEYSDRCNWIVASYTTEEQAKLHVELATEAAKEAVEKAKYRWHVKSTPYDLHISIDYNGVKYECVEVEVYRHVDEWMEDLKGETK